MHVVRLGKGAKVKQTYTGTNTGRAMKEFKFREISVFLCVCVGKNLSLKVF